MSVSTFLVCSERGGKPEVRLLAQSRAEAERWLEELRAAEAADPEQRYWLAQTVVSEELQRLLLSPE